MGKWKINFNTEEVIVSSFMECQVLIPNQQSDQTKDYLLGSV